MTRDIEMVSDDGRPSMSAEKQIQKLRYKTPQLVGLDIKETKGGTFNCGCEGPFSFICGPGPGGCFS